MVEPLIREAKYDRRTQKRCIKCRVWKLRKGDEEMGTKAGFGKHPSSSDGLQSICHKCKNVDNKAAKNKNVTARIRHHIATRCLTQLGKLAPNGFTTSLEDYLGYRIKTLVNHLRKDLQSREGSKRKLRDALNEGYHIDHIRPLMLYKVVMDTPSDASDASDDKIGDINWDAFKECWRMDNLTAIPADENLAKGAKYDDQAQTQTETETQAEVGEVAGDTESSGNSDTLPPNDTPEEPDGSDVPDSPSDPDKGS